MFKRVLQIVVIIVFVGFIVIQFFRPDFTNPPIVKGETLQDSTQVPENVNALLQRSCNDCHSNETVYPWYSKIQPSAWFLKDHIDEGRREMNFSVWNTYETRKKNRKLEEICEQIQSKEMPLPSYLWIHGNAKLSDEEIKIICDWTQKEREKLNQSSAPTE